MIRENVVETINELKGEAGHKRVLDIYNSQCPLPRGYRLQEKDPWCAATVSAVLILNGYTELSECSCPMMVKKAKDLGIWVEDDAFVPQIGDIVLYDWQDSGKGDNEGTPDHIGIVVKVDKNKIVVREGNKNKTIGNRDITVDGLFVRGYITPHYELDSGFLEDSLETSPAGTETQLKMDENVAYQVGSEYTIKVITVLNVRKGAGRNFGLVGYNNLTDDGKKHAVGSALVNGTRVTCKEIKVNNEGETWMKIPSGWVCAISSGNRKYIV